MTKQTLMTPPPDWKWWAKCVAMAVVGAAAAVRVSAESPTVRLVCEAILGAGVMFGIGSGGVGRR